MPIVALRFTADYFTSLEDEEVDVRLAGVTRAGNYANKRLRIRKLMFPGTENVRTHIAFDIFTYEFNKTVKKIF
ncbi:hypothetical protein TNCV_3155571 [Trichonephila clavipes]|nr:hypothetical protein TNCV_3155571 [Trichonephila clavipes]